MVRGTLTGEGIDDSQFTFPHKNNTVLIGRLTRLLGNEAGDEKDIGGIISLSMMGSAPVDEFDPHFHDWCLGHVRVFRD
jgi:hypothetical protein